MAIFDKTEATENEDRDSTLNKVTNSPLNFNNDYSSALFT